MSNAISSVCDGSTGLLFGIYPGSATGDGPLLFDGPRDNPERIEQSLQLLQPAGAPFIVRGYVHYVGSGQIESATPENILQYRRDGRQVDLTLCFRDPEGDIAEWTRFIRDIIREHGESLDILQIGEEATNPVAATGGDGATPNILEGLVAGVLAARDQAQELGIALQVGINATLSFDPAQTFWHRLGDLGGKAFVTALDYVGLDFFPDVFRPLPPDADGRPMSLTEIVEGVLHAFRNTSLAAAGIPGSVPIHITEHGWATSPTRTETRQAEVIESVIRCVYQQRAALNISHYELFGLRDTDSSSDGLQFGLLRDDYSPKPAFAVYKRLIRELGT